MSRLIKLVDDFVDKTRETYRNYAIEAIRQKGVAMVELIERASRKRHTSVSNMIRAQYIKGYQQGIQDSIKAVKDVLN